MEPFKRRRSAPSAFSAGGESQQPAAGREQSRTPWSHRVLDGATAALLCFMVVFTPWAFGTTQPWAIWTMNIAGFLLGLVLLGKWTIRWKHGFRPARWTDSPEDDLLGKARWPATTGDFLAIGMVGLTCLFLLYVLVSALNARAIFVSDQGIFEYFDTVRWLPHSYDRSATWFALWQYVGLACVFWAARDWLLTMTRHDRGEESSPGRGRAEREGEFGSAVVRNTHRALPQRLRLLLWVLCINGALIALEGTLQRLDGTGKLLWLLDPWKNKTADAQFGPYAYRANASQYLNLIWPVCLGFWFVLRRGAIRARTRGMRMGSESYIMLLPCGVLMAGAPFVSTSRGGALIALAMMMIVIAMLYLASRAEGSSLRVGLLMLFVAITLFGGLLGWPKLKERFETVFVDHMSGRTEIYENAVPMAQQFPVFGTGAGSFSAMYGLYRTDLDQSWAGYLHDDWLETRITFGWVGFAMLMACLAIIVAQMLWGKGLSIQWPLVATLFVSMGGVLVHAKYDFPFQVYSITFLFMLLCSVLFCCGRPARV